jgi:hypothetical protein
MTPFVWLCIGHLIGDWMLQNDWMARAKRGRPWGAACLTHCLVYTITLTMVYCVAVAGPLAWSSAGSVALFAGLIFLSHWLIDGANLPWHWGQLMRQTENPTVRLVVDQTMHVIVLAVLVAWMGIR